MACERHEHIESSEGESPFPETAQSSLAIALNSRVFSSQTSANVQHHADKEDEGDSPGTGNDVERVPESQVIGCECAPALLGVMAVDDEEEGEREREDVEERLFHSDIFECPEVWVWIFSKAVADEIPDRGCSHTRSHCPYCKDQYYVRLKSVDSDR